MLSRSASKRRMWTSSCRRCTCSPAPSAASILRISPLRAALRSSASSGEVRHPVFPRRPARHRHHHACGPDKCPARGRQAPRGREDRDVRRGRGRHFHQQAPAARRRAGRDALRPRGRDLAGRPEDMNWIKTEMAEVTNLRRQAGTLADVVRDADVFIGVSQPGLLTGDMVRTMHRDAIVFCLRQPHAGDLPRRGQGRGRGRRQHRPQRLSRTRSTMCWPFRASSAARSTCARPISTSP